MSEQQYYDKLFRKADTNHDGQLNGSEAVALLSLSSLSLDMLEEIWTLIDTNKQGWVNLSQFYWMCRAVGLAQEGHRPTKELMASTKKFPLPRFVGIPVPVPGDADKSSTSHTSSSKSSSSSTATSSGTVNKMPKPTLSASTSSVPGPQQQQNQQQQKHQQQQQQQNHHHHHHHHHHDNDSIHVRSLSMPTGVSELERRRRNTAPDQVLLTPPPKAASARRKMTTGATTSRQNKKSSTSTVFSGNVANEQLSAYVGLFHKADLDQDGFVGGSEARQFFSSNTKLDKTVLAQIWSKSDCDRDGRLSPGEFFLALHLAENASRGVPIPDQLPMSLAPQSLAQRALGLSSI